MGIVSENIKKYYSNPMCSQCDNDICKVYGGSVRNIGENSDGINS